MSIGIKVACWIAAGVLLGGATVRAQISPGALSRAHSHLEGITQCSSCHALGAQGLKCLDCHDEIQRRLDAGTGFHARAYKPSTGDTDCARCHEEHRGQTADLMPLDRQNFDHQAQVGFQLEGKHRSQECGSCHMAAKVAMGNRSEIKLKDLNRSFLGLGRECLSCHEEPHQKQLGNNCLNCHDQQAWKPAAGFDHARTEFPLSGLHQKVACVKCHTSGSAAATSDVAADGAKLDDKQSGRKLLFKGLSFDGCQSCHADPHRGAFQQVKPGGKCDACHNIGGWRSDQPARNFNHDTTKFSLEGKHVVLACGKCHQAGDFRRPLAHELCQNCHEDPHRGQFASRAAGSDCSACHAVTGFKPTLFTRETHMRSAFPLAGKHSSLDCAKCHVPEGPETRYVIGKRACSNCHAEPHGGEFAASPHFNNCDRCHTQEGFQTTTFTIERHAQTQFPLTGRHATVVCGNCHKPLDTAASTAHLQIATMAFKASDPDTPGTTLLSDARRQYHFSSLACNACHRDPHDLDPQAGATCETCHRTDGWKSLLPFDHSRTGFLLDGSHLDASHQPIACIKCHKSPETADISSGGMAPAFSRTPEQCSGCHAEKDVHGDQFLIPAGLKKDCSSCHRPQGWDGAAFNHDRARFALDVAHRNVACTNCHKERKETSGKTVRIFRGTPADCLQCH